MPLTANNPVIFFHSPCLDGETAAWAAWRFFGDDASYFGVNHMPLPRLRQQLLPRIGPDDDVFFIDFAPPPELLREICDTARRVFVYDHHLSAQRDLADFEHPRCALVFDLDKSGAGLAWDVLHPDLPRPLLIDLVEQIDLHRVDAFDHADQFYAVAACLDALELDEFPPLCAAYEELAELGIAEIEERGRPHREAALAHIGERLEKLEILEIPVAHDDAMTAGLLYGDPMEMGREFTHRLFEASDRHAGEEVQMVCSWFEDDADTVRLHIRTRLSGEPGDAPRLDASGVAKHLAGTVGINGGGHGHSAVARFTVEQFETFIARLKDTG